jgi:hypothetical protein
MDRIVWFGILAALALITILGLATQGARCLS